MLIELHGDYVWLINLRKTVTFAKLHFPWEKTELCIYLYVMVYKDTVWFIKIMNDIYMANNLIRDSYGNCVLAGKHYWKVHFPEKENMVKTGYIYKENKKHFTSLQSVNFVSLSSILWYSSRNVTQKWGFCRYFDVCSEYWYYYSFIKKPKKLLKSNTCMFCYFI